MNHLVKIIKDEDKFKIDNPKWCLVVFAAGSPMALCSGQVFGEGEGDAVYKEKWIKQGGITCPKCLTQIMFFKSIKL